MIEQILPLYLSIGFKTDGSIPDFHLRYRIFANPTSQRWLDLLICDLARCEELLSDGVLYGRIFRANQVDHIQSQITQCLRDLDVDGGTLFTRYIRDHYDQQTLDQIHDLKVELASLEKSPGFIFPPGFVKKLERLNFLIHSLEFNGLKMHGGAAVVVPCPPSKVELIDADYREFTLDLKFGSISIDYGTNGVPIQECFAGKLSQVPTPQQNLSSGFNLSFWPDLTYPHHEELRKWMIQNTPEFVDHPRAALGSIPVGEMWTEDIDSAHAKIPCISSISWVAVENLHDKRTIARREFKKVSEYRPEPFIVDMIEKLKAEILPIPTHSFSDFEIGTWIWLARSIEDNLMERLKDPVIWIYRGGTGMFPHTLLSREKIPIGSVRSFDIYPDRERLANLINNHWECQAWKFRAFTANEVQINPYNSKFGPPPHLIVHLSAETGLNSSWWQRIPSGQMVALLTPAESDQTNKATSGSAALLEAYGPFRQVLFCGSKEFQYPQCTLRRSLVIGIKG